MHTSIAPGNVLYKNQTCPALPQSARPVTVEEEEEDEEGKTKIRKFACDKILLVWRDEGT